MDDKIKKIRTLLERNNYAYRSGDYSWFEKNGFVPVTDESYDALVDELLLLNPSDPFLKKIGYDVNDNNKEELPIRMYSADKIHTMDEYYRWVSRNNIPIDIYLVLTPKYDGISLLVKEALEFIEDALSSYKKAWTRGDGAFGQNVSNSYRLIDTIHTDRDNVGYSFYSFGEAIISKNNYNKYFKDKINPKTGNIYGPARNVVGGLINNDHVNELLKYVDYIRYGLSNFDGTSMNKSDMLELLNKLNKVDVPYRNVRVKDVTQRLLDDLFERWSGDYNIDGIVIDVDDAELRNELSIHTSGKYPNYLIAYKPDNEEREVTKVKELKLQISKQGYAKPVLSVNPVMLDGASVKSVTAHNMKFVVDNKIAANAEIMIKRSGFVIPKIVKVITPVELDVDSLKCPICNSKLEWVENDDIPVEMRCSNIDCPGIQYKRVLSFFNILGVDYISDGIVDFLMRSGYDNIKKIIELGVGDLVKLEGFQDKKAKKIVNSISSKLVNIPVSKLQHASGYFYGLGSRKLAIINKYLLNKYGTVRHKPTIDDLTKLEGFQEKSANFYINGFDNFWDFVEWIGVENNIDERDGEVEIVEENEMVADKKFVFTQFRDKDLEVFVKSRGGDIKNSVSKNTDYLIVKNIGGGTSKEDKATKFGIKILDVVTFKNMIGYE